MIKPINFIFFLAIMYLFIGQTMTAISEDQGKVYVVLKENSRAQLEAAFDYAEIKLIQAEAVEDEKTEFEIFACDNSVKLFISGRSPLETRIREMIAEYPKLKVFVCSNNKINLISGVEKLVNCDKKIKQHQDAGWFEFEVYEADD